MTYRTLFLSIVAFLVSGQAEAHHSFSVFDLARRIEIRGELVDFKLRNPHSSFIVDGLAYIDGVAQGTVIERWEVESDATAPMRTTGITASTFAPGDRVTILAAPHRQPGFRFVHAVSLTTASGVEYPFGFRGSDRLFNPALRAAFGAGTPAAATAEPPAPGPAGLSGRWQQPGFRAGAVSALPLNDAGAAAWRSYDPRQSPANRCEPVNVPELFNAPFFLFEIRLDATRALLRSELYDVVRAVPLNGESAPANADPRFGTVTGTIAGNTLVVESRGYPPSGWGLGIATQGLGGGADVPSSDRKTVTERYSVSADGRTLTLDYTLHDPEYLRAPYDGRVQLTRVPEGTEMYPYECDPEAAAMWSRRLGDTPLRVGD